MAGDDIASAFGIGTILATFQSLGQQPYLILRLKMFVILRAILKAVFLNITADIPSIPVDLVTSSLSSAIATQSSVIKNFSGQDVGVHGNRSSSDKGGRHVLKQLKKYWLRVVAFSLLVDASNPFSPTSVGI